MYHTMHLIFLIFCFKTIASVSNQSVPDYNHKLYRDLFAGYLKATGLWRNASELVMVQVHSDLYTIDSVVGDDF
jgi:hypothetical protein